MGKTQSKLSISISISISYYIILYYLRITAIRSANKIPYSYICFFDMAELHFCNMTELHTLPGHIIIGLKRAQILAAQRKQCLSKYNNMYIFIPQKLGFFQLPYLCTSTVCYIQ